jgi:histidinol phosphatase-like enzyme (inositol monophosphatase family)
MMNPESLMQAAAELARLTGDTAFAYFRQDLTIHAKSDGSPVTDADRRAEMVAREWLAARFPADGILGEEFGVVRPEARRQWILDPIDGTKTFVRGVPLWGALVAVREGTQVLAGAAYCPAVNDLVVAGRGTGCWWNDARCEVSEVASLALATVLTTDDRFPESTQRKAGWGELAARALVARTWGDCYGYLLVATGRAEVMVDDIVSAWDAAAVECIIAEAGGVFTDWAGEATAFGGSAIATNAAIAVSARALLGAGREQTARQQSTE